MLQPRPDLIAGSPVFDDPALAAVAHAQGPAAAWRMAWAAHGAQAAAHVRGSFAVALHGDDGSCFLAVDRFGIQTLCWRITEGRLQVSPRADALAQDADGLDPQALFNYLYFHVIPSPATVFDGVARLPAGHSAVFAHGRLTVAPYWVPDFQPVPQADFASARTTFRDLLAKAVADSLDGGKPACFLSGGTDSSTIAGMLRDVAPRHPASYSIGFEAEGYDEMEYARLAARHFGTEHHEYYVTPDDLVRTIPLVAAHYDQPFGNSSALPAYHCELMAQQDGVTRLLAGDGGDELFGGNARYAKQRVFGWYQRVPQALRTAMLEPLLAGAAGRLPLLRKAASYVEQARVPMPDRLQMYNLLLHLGVDDVFDAGFLRRANLAATLDHQRAVWSAPKASADVDRMLAFDWRYTLAEADLPKVSGTAQLAGVEVAFPMLDDRLLDFSMRLPADWKLKGLKLRWFFKEALRGFLPDEIITKTKQGFGLPFGVWATRHDGLRLLASDSLRSLATRGIVRPDFVRRLLDEQLRAHPGYYGEMVWILMMLEQWLRAHRPDWRCQA